jgi:hypothetical protein
MQGVLTLAIQIWSFGSPKGPPSPHFGSVSVILTLFQKWGCDNDRPYQRIYQEQYHNVVRRKSNILENLMPFLRKWIGYQK